MILDIVILVARRLSTRSWLRSMAKTLSWRLFATLDSFVISFLITNNWKWAGSIVGIEAFTKTGWYFAHERAWTRFPTAQAPALAPVPAPAPQPAAVVRRQGPIVVSRARGPTSFHRCLAVHLHYTANSGAMDRR